MHNEIEPTWDFVVYDKDTKEIITVVLELEHDPRFLINCNYVGVYIPHNDYKIIEGDDGKGYFENLNDKVIWLDEYRGRYEE